MPLDPIRTQYIQRQTLNAPSIYPSCRSPEYMSYFLPYPPFSFFLDIMRLTNSICSVALVAAVSAHIRPRCSLTRGPEYYLGTRAIPCWFQMGPTCSLHLRKEAKYSIDAPRKLTTVTGILEGALIW